jgi:hypothetical protein
MFLLAVLPLRIFFNLKGHHPLYSIRPGSVIEDPKNKLCGIYAQVATPAAYRMYRCANFKSFNYKYFINAGKFTCDQSSVQVISAQTGLLKWFFSN